MEELTLTSPISITGYRIQRLDLDWRAAKITIEVVDPNGVQTVHLYSNATATTLMNQLNTLDLSSNSLHKRILNRLVSDGKLPAGTVTGTPD